MSAVGRRIAPSDGLAVAADRVSTAAGERVSLEVVARDNRATTFEFRLRLATVEVWHAAHCCAVLDRVVLQEWLSMPSDPLTVDEVTLTAGQVAQVVIFGVVGVVESWPLSPSEAHTLRKHV